MNRHGIRIGRTIAFLGISGSGKGTQAERLLRALPRSVDISTGGAFRRIAARSNLVGRFTRRVLSRGEIMPYWAPAYVWLNAFFERLKGDESIIFDGAPRLVAEAEMMDDFMRDVGRPLPIAIYLELSPRAARERLLARGRADDNARAIAGRFAFFRRNVRPVIAYYRRHRRLIVINGEQSPAEVWRDIRTALQL
ncbi:MAG: nucleoside monophosphate kinase [Candidatus Sungbacteria bacterium]|uniref:Adenylate kinase n=1 Tax=Candidatus Sungiibacteriota bacterium TaxID=2750080 RepID=A0A932YWW3_9BACT|nr:nucleoside monophosphate kinase [Candidatus Sungbacteria bacterium]